MFQPIKSNSVVVVIPYYNGASWIERAVKSVREQTIEPNEFIVVNDGSKAEERAALDPLASKYDFLIVDKVNGGQGSARNAGVAASKSEFVSLLDQDDFYLPHHIEDLLSVLPANDYRLGYVYADLCAANEKGDIVNSNFLRQMGRHPKEGDIAGLLQADMFVLPSASLLKRSAFESLGGFDEQFMGYEDDDLFLRMFRAGFTNYYLDKPVTVWCMRQTSTSYTIRMSRSRFRYFKKLAKLYPDEFDTHRFYIRDCLIGRFADSIVADAVKPKLRDEVEIQELSAIFAEFCDIIESLKSIHQVYRDNVRFTQQCLAKGMLPAKSPDKPVGWPVLLDSDQKRRLVSAFYNAYLGRSPKGAELESCVILLDQQKSFSSVARSIEAEHRSRSATPSVGAIEKLLDLLYEFYLLRAADQDGLSHYMRQVGKQNLSDVIFSFESSKELEERHLRPNSFFPGRGLYAASV